MWRAVKIAECWADASEQSYVGQAAAPRGPPERPQRARRALRPGGVYWEQCSSAPPFSLEEGSTHLVRSNRVTEVHIHLDRGT